MASAIMARRNEPHWPEANVYMKKPHPNSRSKPPNPNPNFDLAGAASPDRADEPTVSSGAAAVSDDSSKAAAGGHGDSGFGYVAFNIANYTKAELRELKRRLVSELEQVRGVIGRIESREIQSSLGHSVSGMYGGGGGREVTSFHSGEGFVERPAKKKKATAAFGGCRPATTTTTKRFAAAPQPPESERVLADMMTKCRQILTKLLKQKGSNWFKTPVDVEGMKLFDYYQTIKHPMDLGTVRTNLSKGVYATPLEFADDIRLTFNNALIYNPKGHVVHEVAGRMLRYFDGEFGSAYAWYENQQASIVREHQASLEREEKVRRIDRSHTPKIIHRSHAPVFERSYAPMVERSHPPSRADPVLETSPPRPAAVRQTEPISVPDHALAEQHHHQQEEEEHQQQQHINVSKRVTPGMPKPKTKDVSKRPMSDDEKGKLGEALQNLPQDKMEQALQIVKDRHGALNQEGDEVELDFEAFDAETLWELDRFVSNFWKSMSKLRRQEAMATGTISAAPQSLSVPAEDGNQSPMADATKKIKKSEPADDDVIDIGDDLPTKNYPSVEIEKDNAAGGYASSSGSDSSSSTGSSGSDSDSSSDSDDDDHGRNPATGPRPSP